MPLKLNIDIASLRKQLDREGEEWERQTGRDIKRILTETGEKAVQYAKEHGTYRDVTGRLRESNFFKVEDRALIIGNSAPYAQDVEDRGEEVFLSAAVKAEAELIDKLS